MVEGVDRREALLRLAGPARGSLTGLSTRSSKSVAVAKPISKPDWTNAVPFGYFSADGKFLYQNVRVPLLDEQGLPLLSKKGKPDKTFVQRHTLDGGRTWQLGRGDAPAVAYALPDLIKAIDEGETVFVVEGEAKVIALLNWGFAATSFASGTKGKAELLAGADVVLCPDKDAAGAKYAKEIATEIRGSAKRVRLLELPGVKVSGDIIDWIDDGGDVEAFSILADHAIEYPFEGAPIDRSQMNGHPAPWLDKCFKGNNGNVMPIVANALTGLRDGYPHRYAFDEMLRAIL
jgi:hypothetical protein